MHVTQLDLNSVMLFLVALLNAFSAYLTHRGNKQIKVIEKATNSMKDALVATTAKAALAEGTAIGRKEKAEEMNAAMKKDAP